jgi:hypothetical protein
MQQARVDTVRFLVSSQAECGDPSTTESRLQPCFQTRVWSGMVAAEGGTAYPSVTRLALGWWFAPDLDMLWR